MATWNSSSYDGRYMQLTVTEEVDVYNNRSKLTWTLKTIGGAVNYYSTGPTTVTIAGEQVYNCDRKGWSTEAFPAAKGSKSGSLYVNHNSDGKKTISVSFSTAIYYSAVSSYGGDMTLTNIDVTAPTVRHSVSNITSNSLKITVNSNVTADIWWYSLNGGTNWTQFSTTSATSREITVTGLTANTTYSVRAAARKKSNRKNGYSTAANAKTLGASFFHSANTVDADAATVNVKASITVYDASFYHKLILNNGTSDIITINAGQLTAGKSDRTFTLTAAQRKTLLQNITGKTLSGKLYLKTYTASNYSTQVGSTSECAVSFATDETTSRPTFTGFTWDDTRTAVKDIVGANGNILLQDYSYLQVFCSAGTAKNEASISSYSVSVGGASASSTDVTLNVGAISTDGDLEITVTCTDSRGYSTSVKGTITVLPYSKPKITAYRLRRKDEVEPLVQLSFSGSFSAIEADGETNTNSLKYVGYYYKETSADSYEPYISLLGETTVRGTNFEFSSDELIELDANKSYNVHILVRDQLNTLSSCDLYITLAQGTPIVALRKRNSTYNFPRVGINNPNPTEAVDVIGNVKQNGQLVQGFVAEFGNTEKLNNYTKGGLYHQAANANASTDRNYPAAIAGFLEVFGSANGDVMQRYTTFDNGAVYVRTYYAYNRTWSAWRNIS